MKKTLVVCLMALGASIGSAPTAAAQVDTATYMLVPGIKGEVDQKVYKDWIEVLSVSQAFSGQKNSTACTVQLAKRLDKSGPPLWTAAVTGQVFNEVRIDFLKDGLFQYKYYELTLTNAQVTSITASPDALVEQLTISGDSATLKYYEQSADGTIRAPVAATVECK